MYVYIEIYTYFFIHIHIGTAGDMYVHLCMNVLISINLHMST